MHRLATIFSENLLYVYFFYGLAFFAMGLSVAVESRRTSELSLAEAAWLLAGFGLLHGSHEWLEMFLILGGQRAPLWLDWARVALLAISFLFLLAFGVRLLPRSQQMPRFAERMVVLACVAYLMQLGLVRVTFRPTSAEWVRAADALARYSLCIPGGILACLALIRQHRVFRLASMERYSHNLVWAAVAFAWYAIAGQSFPPSSIIFPSMYINTETFLRLAGFPVQVMRASMASVVAISVIRALRAFEAESQLRLERAREAEQRSRQDLTQLNRELQTAARELSLLYEASRLLTTPLDLEMLLREAIAKIVNVVEPVEAGSILAQTGGAVPARYRASYGYDSTGTVESNVRVPVDLSDLAPLWLSDKDRDVSEETRRKEGPSLNGHHIRFVALPLQTRQAVLGYLILETDPAGPYLSSAEAPTIRALARQLAIAIENAALLHEIHLRDARRGELLQRITAAQEAERQRIARELHDETGQTLTGLALGLSSVVQLVRNAPDQAVAQVAGLRDTCTHAISELRQLINYLRPSQLDDLGLVAALRWHVEQINGRSPTEFRFEVHGRSRRLPPEIETTLFRIAQEGLTNVVKHANAQSATLQLEYAKDVVTLDACDDGRGFAVEEKLRPGSGFAWGLVGIQERATLAGGELTIESTPGKGTCLRLSVPYTAFDPEKLP